MRSSPFYTVWEVTGSFKIVAAPCAQGAQRRRRRSCLSWTCCGFRGGPRPRLLANHLPSPVSLSPSSWQVWFQNRRSKERRMKQLSALGARRHAFFRSPRRMRPLVDRLEPGELIPNGPFSFYGGGYWCARRALGASTKSCPEQKIKIRFSNTVH